MITFKYLDGLPLYRQAALLGRFGGKEMSRNTLAAGVVRVCQAAQPVLNLMRDALLDSFIVHGDETEIHVLKEPGRIAQAKSYMWVQMTQASGVDGTGPPIRLFGYSPSRSRQAARIRYEGIRPGGLKWRAWCHAQVHQLARVRGWVLVRADRASWPATGSCATR